MGDSVFSSSPSEEFRHARAREGGRQEMVASISDVSGGGCTSFTGFSGKPQTFFARWKIAQTMGISPEVNRGGNDEPQAVTWVGLR